MEKKKISVVIPYANRIQNLTYVLKSLSEQTLNKNDFEIVVGCLEASEELAKLINDEYSTMNIIVVMSIQPWNTAKARNIALSVCTGEYIVFVDADMVLPQKSLELFLTEHMSDDRVKLILGQAKSYDEWDDREHVQHLPYDEYREKFLMKDECDELPRDRRLETEICIPWAMCWTGFISIPRQAIFEHDLFFDHNFKGWGVEDIEWGYRVQQAGIATVLPEHIWSIHLPHERDAEKNHEYEQKNFKSFLKKSPCFEVEVVARFGDFNGNSRIKELKAELNASNYSEEDPLYVIEETLENSRNLYIGARIDNGIVSNLEEFGNVPSIQIDKSIPLLGISLPYNESEFDNVYISRNIQTFTQTIQDLIIEESERVVINN